MGQHDAIDNKRQSAGQSDGTRRDVETRAKDHDFAFGWRDAKSKATFATPPGHSIQGILEVQHRVGGKHHSVSMELTGKGTPPGKNWVPGADRCTARQPAS